MLTTEITKLTKFPISTCAIKTQFYFFSVFKFGELGEYTTSSADDTIGRFPDRYAQRPA